MALANIAVDMLVEPSEQRRSCRLPGADVPEVSGVRVRPGRAMLTLVDLSGHGALLRGVARLLPGSVVTLQFLGPKASPIVRARVLRCSVATLDPLRGVSYEGAVCFSERFDLPRRA